MPIDPADDHIPGDVRSQLDRLLRIESMPPGAERDACRAGWLKVSSIMAVRGLEALLATGITQYGPREAGGGE
jgi:hypothetical protein